MLIGQIIYIWLVSALIGIISFPLIFFICPRLKDRGYSISKILGLVLVTYIAWMLSSLRLFPFGTSLVGGATICLAVFSLWLGWKRRVELSSFLREKLKLILGLELLFLLALIVFLLIISLNPNIDADSERFMDYALLNGIDRTHYFPPLDPWFAGRTMNYYYYGYIIVATLHKLVVIPLPVFFNLVLGVVYALFTLTCFGMGYNLAGKKSYGFLAILILMFIGNLDGFIQIMGGEFSSFDFFHGARVMVQGPPDAPLDYPINEFPFFSLMWGDLHPYVIAFPLNLALLNLVFNLALSPFPGLKSLGEKPLERALNLFVLSLTLGALFGTNTWDYPIYLVVAISVLAFNHWKTEKQLREKAACFIPPALTLSLSSFLFYLPFNLDFIREQAGQGRGGVGLVSLRSPLGLFLIAFGIFLFFPASYLIARARVSNVIQTKRNFSRGPFLLFLLASLLIIAVSGPAQLFGQTYLVLLLLFLLLAAVLFLSPLKTGEHFPLILALSALGLAFICEFYFLKDHYLGGGYERMNTVFKIYIHVWLFLGAASIYFIFHVNQLLKGRNGPIFFWKTAVGLMLLAGFFYTWGALNARIRGRNQPLTLDGTAYIERPVPSYQKKEWRWDLDDWKAARWLEENVRGRPIILEATGNAYDWASRIATFTGLPTLVGWVNHEAGWRNDWTEPGRRQKDTQTIYSTTNPNVALNLIYRYAIEYIYIGRLERELYSDEALAKFARIGQPVYREGPVEIYRVGR